MDADTDRHQDRPQTESPDKAAAAAAAPAPAKPTVPMERAFILCQCPEIENQKSKDQSSAKIIAHFTYVSFRSHSRSRSPGSNQKQIRVNPQSTHMCCDRDPKMYLRLCATNYKIQSASLYWTHNSKCQCPGPGPVSDPCTYRYRSETERERILKNCTRYRCALESRASESERAMGEWVSSCAHRRLRSLHAHSLCGFFRCWGSSVEGRYISLSVSWAVTSQVGNDDGVVGQGKCLMMATTMHNFGLGFVFVFVFAFVFFLCLAAFANSG